MHHFYEQRQYLNLVKRNFLLLMIISVDEQILPPKVALALLVMLVVYIL